MSEVKYLGVHLCEHFSDDMSMSSCIKGLYIRGHILKRDYMLCSQEVRNYFRVFARNYIVVHYGAILLSQHIIK